MDEALFGLGEQRYAALVDLLIQLRQPQLSKRPNEAALSRALTEALPPMDQAVIADVAEAFRSLDEEKEELRAAAEAEKAASAFLDHYRRYARIASRRRARLPRAEHAKYESLQRELSDARADRSRAEEERGEAEQRLAALEEAEARLKAQDAALREGPEMRSARELEQAAQHARRTADARDRAEADRGQAEQMHARALARLSTAGNRLTSADDQAGQALARVGQVAADAHVELPRKGNPPATPSKPRRTAGGAPSTTCSNWPTKPTAPHPTSWPPPAASTRPSPTSPTPRRNTAAPTRPSGPRAGNCSQPYGNTPPVACSWRTPIRWVSWRSSRNGRST